MSRDTVGEAIAWYRRLTAGGRGEVKFMWQKVEIGRLAFDGQEWVFSSPVETVGSTIHAGCSRYGILKLLNHALKRGVKIEDIK